MRLFATFALATFCCAQPPDYSVAGLVDAAANVPGRFAPNSRATLYGRHLTLPNSPDSIRVQLGTFTVPVTYAGPNQVNFIVPSGLVTGASLSLVVYRGSLAGPVLPVTLQPEAPELFLLPNSVYALTALPGGALVTPESPAVPGSIVVLYANGLGVTLRSSGGLFPGLADPLLARLDVWLDGRLLPPEHVLYAGTAPGYAALYQVNLRLPEDVGPNPLIRLGFRGEASSHPTVRLAVGGSGNAPAL